GRVDRDHHHPRLTGRPPLPSVRGCPACSSGRASAWSCRAPRGRAGRGGNRGGGCARPCFQNPSADRCLAVQVAALFSCNLYRAFQHNARPRLIRIPMNAMALTRPTELQVCRVRLTASPAAAGEARGQVRAAIRAWEIPVDPDIAVLLTSELVTNAISHETGTTI